MRTYERRECRSGRLTASAAAIATLLCAQGCVCTRGVWGWARTPEPRSRAVRVESADGGGHDAIVALRGAPDRADGTYRLPIPAGWTDLPVRPSAWGRRVVELASASAAAEPATSAPVGPAVKVARLPFATIVEGEPPPEGTSYGTVCTWIDGRPVMHLFGYDAGKGRWVRLCSVPVDLPRHRSGRKIVATLLSPMTGIADLGVLLALSGGSSSSHRDGPLFPPPPGEAARLEMQLHRDGPLTRLEILERLRWCRGEATRAVPSLRGLVKDDDAKLRLAAAYLLGRLCPDDPDFYMPTLKEGLRGEAVHVRRAVVRFLAEVRPEAGFEVLMSALRDSDRRVRTKAVEALMEYGRADAGGALLRLFSSASARERPVILAALAKLKPVGAEATRALFEALRDEEPRVRTIAAAGLAHMGPNAPEGTRRAIETLAATDPSFMVRSAARELLRKAALPGRAGALGGDGGTIVAP